jgi:hypothetical protein
MTALVEEVTGLLIRSGEIDAAATPDDFALLIEAAEDSHDGHLRCTLVERARRRITAVLKLVRDSTSQDRFLREAYGLNCLHGRLPPHLRAAVPRAVFLGEVAGSWGLLTTGFGGDNVREILRVAPRSQRLVAALEPALSWLADFQRETRLPRREVAIASLTARGERSQQSWRWAKALSRAEARSLEAVADWLERGSLAEDWIVSGHGNLRLSDLFMDAGHFTITNWERYEDEVAGYHDFASLLVEALEIHRHLPPSPLRSSELRGVADRFLDRIGVARTALLPLLVRFCFDEIDRLENRLRHDKPGNGMSTTLKSRITSARRQLRQLLEGATDRRDECLFLGTKEAGRG